MTPDHTTCTLTEPGSIEALTFLKGLQDKGYQPSISQLGGSGADDEYNLFKSGKVGHVPGRRLEAPERQGLTWPSTGTS